MSDDSSNKTNWRKKLKSQYRLVILNNETFAELGNYRISLQNIYILISSIIVILSFLFALILIFTPVKRLIPGYGELKDNRQFIELNKKLDSIDALINANELYLISFQRMLTAGEDSKLTEPSDEDKFFNAIEESLKANVAMSKADQKDLKANQLEVIRNGSLGNTYLIPPLKGIISEDFMPDSRHYGVDVLAPANTPIQAVKDGYVIISGWNLETGHTLGIQHDDNMVSFYKHNSALLKETGVFVKAGEVVAIIGNTGTLSDGPHLHFELWLGGNPVNPEDYINFE